MSLPTPITRKEAYLAAIAGEEVQVPEKPITREEAYLDAIAKGGGGGGTIDPTPTEGSTNAVSSGGTYTALEGKLDASEKGTASGVAELDANGKVLSSQLPSFVDDVVEGYYDSTTDRFYEESTFENVIEPVEGKSWVDIPANKSYRWTGTVYVRVDEGVQLGETSNSAFRGDWGKTLKDTMGTGTLDTEAQTVIGAVNELKGAMPTDLADLEDDSTHRTVTDTEKAEWSGKQDSLTFDTTPTEDSENPVTSGGIKTAIDDSVSLKTATGNPITLTDAANANAEGLLMTIEPIQSGSGDPSPTNVRPISGLTEGKVVACGKNIAHIDSTKIFSTDKNPSDPITGIADGMLILSTASNGYIRNENLGSYTINNLNSITGEIVANGSYGFGIVVEVDDTKTYTLNLVKTGGTVRIGWLNSDGSNLSYTADQTLPCNLTPPSGAKYLMIVCCPGQNAEHTFSDIQLEEGTTATPYEPYTAANATITFGQTVYGGSVNFKTGEVTVTHGYGKIKDFTWLNGSANKFYCAPSNCKGDTKIIASAYPYCGSQAVSGNPSTDKAIGHWGAQLVVMDTTYNNATNFVAAMGEEEVCYELATPTTLTLTPAELELLKGNNTITANGAEISLSYYPDNAIGALAGRVDAKPSAADVDTRVRQSIYELGEIDSYNGDYYGQVFPIESGNADLTLFRSPRNPIAGIPEAWSPALVWRVNDTYVMISAGYLNGRIFISGGNKYGGTSTPRWTSEVLTDKSIAQAQVIKRKYVSGTTSANGNVSLNDFDKSNTVIVGCQMRIQSGDIIVAVPYTYSGLDSGKWGLHCTSESASGEAVANKLVVGYIYYVDMPAYDSAQD